MDSVSFSSARTLNGHLRSESLFGLVAKAFVGWPEEEVADLSVRDVGAFDQLGKSLGIEELETRSAGGGESVLSPSR